MTRQSIMNPKRVALFKLVCLSLFTSPSMGFTTSSMPLHLAPQMMNQPQSPSTTMLQMAQALTAASSTRVRTRTSSRSALPVLTREEETEALRQAVELRRLTQLETEMALKSPTRKLPFLSVRAKGAGYGDELEAYEDAKLDGQTARDLLVTRNMGLVHYCVNQILGNRRTNRLNSLSRDDLVQEGAIGLARAIDKWNPAIGGKFSTYAVYWVRAAVLRCIAERDDMLRVPSHVSQAVSKINKSAKRLGLDLDLDLDNNTQGSLWKEATAAKQLAEEAGLSERNFEVAMKVRSRRYTGGYVAFEEWMQYGEDLQSDVPTTPSDPGMSALESEHLRTTLAKFLRPKEMEAISWRYGLLEHQTHKAKANRYLAEAEEELFGTSNVVAPKRAKSDLPAKGRFGEAMTFNEVGKRMQVSAEYGRKLCHAALKKLQQAAEEGRLETALIY
jgi:RNA polymerase sigma factor (sigma-70 family)